MLAADEIKRLLAVANEPFEDEENEEVAAPEPRLDLATRTESFASLDNRPAEQEAEDEEGAVSIEDALAATGAYRTPVYRTPRTITQEFSTGLARGTDQTQGLLYGFTGLVGQALGVEGLEEFGLENYTRKMEEAALNEATVRDPFDQIGGVGDAATYAAGIIGEQIPQLLVSLGGAGIGGLAARTVAKRVIANEVAKRAAAGMTKKEAEREVASLVARNALTAAGTATQRGAIGGAYLGNFGLISGGSFGEIAEETGEGNALIAAAFAAPGAALDTLSEVFIAGKFIKPFTRGGRAAAEGVETATGISFPSRVARNVGVGLPATSAIEGGTEYLQTGFEQAALGAADPNQTIEEVVGTPEAERERRIAAVAGATVGGALGGAGSVIESLAPRTAAELRRKTQQRRTEQESQEEQPEQIAGGWMDPVTVPSRNESFGQIQFRRNEAGQVAAFNVPEDYLSELPRVQTELGPAVLISRAYKNGAAIRAQVNAAYTAKENPDAFKAPERPRPQFKQEDLVDADLRDGEVEVSEEDLLAQAAERRRLRDAEILQRNRQFAEAAVNRPPEDARGFVSSLTEGDQVSVISQDEDGNQFSIPMTFVRVNDRGQAQLRTEPDEENNVQSFVYDPEDFNLITTRNVVGEKQDAPAPSTPTPRLTAPITPAEGQELTAEERAQNLIFFSDQGRKIDENLWRNSARDLGIELTEDMQSAQAVEMAVRRQFGLDRPVSKQSDPASEILIDALGPNPTRQKLESITGTPWTGPGAEFTWGVKDNLGGEIPVTTRLFNRKTPAEPLDIPTRPDVKGFKPEEQGTRPAAPNIESKGPDLVATSRAEFVGVLDGKGAPVNQRPTRGQDNATYLTRVDTAADTTIRQMNFLGQPVKVSPQTAQSLAEANQFWIEQQERQRTGRARPRDPVQFFTQERADKDGNRATYITGVTYEGRTYRVGKTPDDFTVDKPLTERGANSRRRGRGIYDNIRRASEKRKVRSEAGMEAREVEGGPLAAALTGVKGRPALPDLNEAENSAFGFYDARITGPLAEAQGIDEATRDRALEAARARLAAAFVEAKKAVPGEKTTVLPARQRVIGEKVSRKLVEYQDAKRFLALEKLREKFKALSAKTAAAKKGAKGTGAAKALKMSPQGAQNLITRAGRNQKVGLSPEKRATREEALEALQELVDFSALDQKKKDEQIRKILAAAERFTEVDRDFMSEQIISELAAEDRAIAAKQGRAYERTTAQVAADRRLVKNTFELLGSDSIRSLNPYRIGQTALGSAKRTATREDINRPTESIDDEESGAADKAAMQSQPRQRDDTGPITQAKLAERGRSMGVEGATGGQIAAFVDSFEEAQALLDSLPESDKDVFLTYAEANIERQGGTGSQTSQPEVDRLWAEQIERFLNGSINRNQLETLRRDEKRIEEGRRIAERTVPRPRSAELANLRRGVSVESELAGVAESRARRSPDAAPEGRPERVVGDSADAAGTVQGQDAGTAGGRGVQPTPFRTRTVAAAAQRDFAGALLGLNEAETAALPQAIVDRVYQAYLSTLDAKAAEDSNNPLTATAAPMADAVTLDGKKLFERYADERLSLDQIRAIEIRQNMAQAYRAGLFDDNPVVSAINKLANDETQPRQLRLMAKEFVKNARRGVQFENVVLDLGRFTSPDGSRSTWAGLFGISPDGEAVISINLDNLHDQDSLPLSFLHELQHVVIRDKVRRRVPLTRTEEAALDRLDNFRRQAVLAAARDQGIEVGANPDINALAKQLYNLTDPNRQQSGAAVDNRRLAGLVNLEEFVIEMIGNPEFVGLLAELGFGSAETQGRKFSLTGAIRDAWNAVVELITGYKVDPTSPLAMAFKDSWTINFGTSRNPNITEIKAGSRMRQREQRQMVTDYINREIEDRNMAGTTRDRQAIGREISGPADRSTQRAADRVREAATTLSLEEFVQWAPANGFNFVDPIAVYQSLREPTDQGSRDTVQVSQSRARAKVTPKAAGRALLRLAEQRGQALFQLPATLSDSESLLEVMGSTGQPFSLVALGGRSERNPENYFVSSQNSLEVGAPALFETEDGYEKTVITAVTPKTVGVRLSDGSETFKPKQTVVTGRGWVGLSKRGRWIMGSKRGDIDRVAYAISSDRGNEWPIVNSRELYQGIYQWAHNTKKLIVPDATTSWAGNYRRNAHQLSSALRNKSADHFIPTVDQLKRMFPDIEAGPDRQTFDGLADPDMWDEIGADLGLVSVDPPSNPVLTDAWNALGTEEKIAALARAEISYVEQAIPELVSMVYDQKTDSFRDLDQGRSLDRNQARERLGELITRQEGREDLAEPNRVGEATLVRYIAEKAALEGRLGNGAARDGAQSNLDQIAYSRAKPRVWNSAAEATYTGGYYQPGGMFSVDELLDNRAGDMDRARRQKLKEGEYRAREAGVFLNNLIKKEYGDLADAPINLLNDAIGNLDNPLTDAQRAEIATLRETDEEAASQKAIEFIGANRERFRRERQLPALQQLPVEIAEAAREMSNMIAELSQRAIDLGIVRGDMAATFSENLGIALTRSYSIFSDPKWVDKLRREDREMGEASRMGVARQYIRGMMLSQLTEQMRTEAAERGTPISRQEAERRAQDGISNEQVDAILDGYLAVAREEPSIETLSGSVPGRKRMKGLTPRGNLAPEIRALWGQTENPAINFATTYLKLKTLVANQEFLDDLTSFGKKEGWVFDPESPDNRGERHPPGYVQITGKADKSLDPLGGLYLHPLLARGLTEMFPVGSTTEHYWWIQKLMQATGLSMAMQTVGSVVAQVRNYLGNYFPMIAGGNLGVGDILNGTVKKNLSFAHEAAFAAAFRQFGGDRKKWLDLVGQMYREGLMGESVSVGLINDLTQLGKLSGLDDDAFASKLDKLVKRPVKKTWDKAMMVYSMGDDIFKVFTAFMEMDKYRRAFPDMPEARIRSEAIKRARDIHWTYSLAPQIVQDLKKFPFIAPFVTFTTEVIRTTVNLAKLAKSEIQEGRRTGNQELENIGWQRVRGMTTVAVLPAGLGTLAMTAAGISGDDLEDLRRFLPDWQKNSQLLPFKKANGEVSFIDISYLDPYETWKKPVTALMRGLMNADRADEIITEGVVGMAMQALDPFTSEQIFAGAVMDVIRNNTASGRQVYNPQDSGAAIAENIAKQLVSPFVPGTGRSIDRIIKAASGSTSESGRDYELFNEVANVFTGSRLSAVNVEQALGFKASQFLRNRRDARGIFSREFTARGTRTPDDVIGGYQRANQSLRDLTAEMRRDYLAAINLGLPVAKSNTLLRSAGLDRDAARAVRTGIYRRLTPSDDQRKLAPKDRISALNRVLAETPDREALP
jgi:hypothetical protein